MKKGKDVVSDSKPGLTFESVLRFLGLSGLLVTAGAPVASGRELPALRGETGKFGYEAVPEKLDMVSPTYTYVDAESSVESSDADAFLDTSTVVKEEPKAETIIITLDSSFLNSSYVDFLASLGKSKQTVGLPKELSIRDILISAGVRIMSASCSEYECTSTDASLCCSQTPNVTNCFETQVNDGEGCCQGDSPTGWVPKSNCTTPPPPDNNGSSGSGFDGHKFMIITLSVGAGINFLGWILTMCKQNLIRDVDTTRIIGKLFKAGLGVCICGIAGEVVGKAFLGIGKAPIIGGSVTLGSIGLALLGQGCFKRCKSMPDNAYGQLQGDEEKNAVIFIRWRNCGC